MIQIELDAVRKDVNASEWRWMNRASSCGLEEVGDHNIIVKLCRRLVEGGHTGDVEVFRDETPCFSPMSVELWAEGGKRGKQPEGLRKFSGEKTDDKI